ncbi:MAG: glycosyl transferase, partial [Thermodesulfobacteriota bacterium]
YDRHEEIEAVDAFVGSMKLAIDEFVGDPIGIPMMAAWVRVEAAMRDFSERLNEAVEEDNR